MKNRIIIIIIIALTALSIQIGVFFYNRENPKQLSQSVSKINSENEAPLPLNSTLHYQCQNNEIILEPITVDYKAINADQPEYNLASELAYIFRVDGKLQETLYHTRNQHPKFFTGEFHSLTIKENDILVNKLGETLFTDCELVE